MPDVFFIYGTCVAYMNECLKKLWNTSQVTGNVLVQANRQSL